MHIKVKVFSESGEDRVDQVGKDAYEVYVRAGAQNGHANKEVIYLLSKHFGKGIKMVSGGTRQSKIFEVL
ncbi:MAG: DUF167 domain-containing protein [Patescibacteria group bacterium]